MTLNPNANANERERRAVNRSVLRSGYVTGVNDDNNNLINVQPVAEVNEVPMRTLIKSTGDIYIPDESANLRVVYAETQAEYPLILGFAYTSDDDVPVYRTGERRISHTKTDTDIHFDEDGNVTVDVEGGAVLEVKENGDVVINGGSKGAIYDIDTTKDAEGHVTDITLKRRSDINEDWDIFFTPWKDFSTVRDNDVLVQNFVLLASDEVRSLIGENVGVTDLSRVRRRLSNEYNSRDSVNNVIISNFVFEDGQLDIQINIGSDSFKRSVIINAN
jgi:hypothetical protein